MAARTADLRVAPKAALKVAYWAAYLVDHLAEKTVERKAVYLVDPTAAL